MNNILTEYRNTIEEIKYYACDLNKFIALNCRKDMTICNMDCIQFRFNVNGIKRLRMIEYKHENEETGNAQEKLLKEISNDFRILNEIDKTKKRELFIIRGNPPFDYVEIVDFVEANRFTFNNKKDFVDFLNFEK